MFRVSAVGHLEDSTYPVSWSVRKPTSEPMPIPEEDSTDSTGTRDWLLAFWRWFFHFLKASGLGRWFPAMWCSTCFAYLFYHKVIDSGCPRKTSSRWGKGGAFQGWWKPTFLTIVDMANMTWSSLSRATCKNDVFWLPVIWQKQRWFPTNSCSDDLTKSHDRWRPSHWSRQQHGDSAKGGCLFLCIAQKVPRKKTRDNLDVQTPLGFWGCFLFAVWELGFWYILSRPLDFSKMIEFQQVVARCQLALVDMVLRPPM